MFCVSSIGDTSERETQKEVKNLVFPYMEGEGWFFSFLGTFDQKKKENIKNIRRWLLDLKRKRWRLEIQGLFRCIDYTINRYLNISSWEPAIQHRELYSVPRCDRNGKEI